MISRILNFLHKDVTNGLRNNMVVYTVVFPVLLAVGLSFFLPGMEKMKPTIAVYESLEPGVIERLRDYGKLELFDSLEKVKTRVERPDDVAGIVMEGKEYVVLLEGNEAGDAEEISRAIMNVVLTGYEAEYERISLGKTSNTRALAGALLLLTAALIGGLISGLNIVEEKETRAMRALAVSPLRRVEFIAAHVLLCLLSGTVLAVISSLILAGTEVSLLQIVIAMLCSTGVSVIFGLLIGTLADNAISAVAVMKVLFLFMVSMPIASLFVPDRFQWVFYIFPPYWAFQTYQAVFEAGQQFSFGVAGGVTLLSTVVLAGILTPMFNRRLRLR